MPMPSSRPRQDSTTHAIVDLSAVESQPRATIHHTIAANNASSSTTPRVPIDENVERMKNSQAPSKRMPAITTTGCIGVRFCCNQWK